MTATLEAGVAISLRLRCLEDDCETFAVPLFTQLGSGKYDVCSVLTLADFPAWNDEHKTARRRASRAATLGYVVGTVRPEEYVDDVFAINTSLARRQGRPMSPAYLEKPATSPDPEWPCSRHRVNRYGVLEATGRLVAYAWVYRCGDLALVSQILGHGDHLSRDVMFLLMRGVVAHEMRTGGTLVYNRHDSGTDGLRYFKERIGFQPREVAWLP